MLLCSVGLADESAKVFFLNDVTENFSVTESDPDLPTSIDVNPEYFDKNNVSFWKGSRLHLIPCIPISLHTRSTVKPNFVLS